MPGEIDARDNDVRADGKECRARSLDLRPDLRAVPWRVRSLCRRVGTLKETTAVRTFGNWWPYATTLFDYGRRAMPFNAPESLTVDQGYAVSAYVLSLNGVLPDDAVVNATNLPNVAMPNRNGFVSPDPRPDVRQNQSILN